MIYLLFVLIAALATAAVLYVSSLKGAVDTGKFNIYKPCGDCTEPYRGKSLILLTIVCFVITAAIQISLYNNTTTVNFIKLFGVFLITLSAGIIDSKQKIIPNLLIIIGLLLRAGIYVYEILFMRSELKSIAINDAIGFGIGFVFLGLISILTKGSLGFGDAKLFGVIGLTCGSFCTYSTLFVSLVISAVISIISIARKKMDRKTSFPFGPCITAGYIIVILLTSY